MYYDNIFTVLIDKSYIQYVIHNTCDRMVQVDVLSILV